MIKIIFFDIDGTLIDMQKKQISPQTLEMLKRLKQNGICICLATGRSPVSLPVFDGWCKQVPPNLLRKSHGALQVDLFHYTRIF